MIYNSASYLNGQEQSDLLPGFVNGVDAAVTYIQCVEEKVVVKEESKNTKTLKFKDPKRKEAKKDKNDGFFFDGKNAKMARDRSMPPSSVDTQTVSHGAFPRAPFTRHATVITSAPVPPSRRIRVQP